MSAMPFGKRSLSAPGEADGEAVVKVTPQQPLPDAFL
jgi:hypothetical protein